MTGKSKETVQSLKECVRRLKDEINGQKAVRNELNQEIRRLKRIESASLRTIEKLVNENKSLRKDLLKTQMELIEETERNEDLEKLVEGQKQHGIQEKHIHA